MRQERRKRRRFRQRTRIEAAEERFEKTLHENLQVNDGARSLASDDRLRSVRQPWQRVMVEINGRPNRKYLHSASALIAQSYSKVAGFPHTYHSSELPCPTHMDSFLGGIHNQNLIRSEGISALEFDRKGIYLASVTKSGCLTVHDFEDLFYEGKTFPLDFKEDEGKLWLHISSHSQLDAVRWNTCNQNEVACTSLKSSEVHIYDIGCVSSEPVAVLEKRPTASVNGYRAEKGLTDIAFSSSDSLRLFASDISGMVNVWDRRKGHFPCYELKTKCRDGITSVKLTIDNQVVFGASKHGIIYIWDVRGGRSSAAFQNYRDNFCLSSLKLETHLGKIKSLKAQTSFCFKEIHSIDINPSCRHQLAFHLEDSRSGVFDLNSMNLTHVHCPPPAWSRDGFNDWANLSLLRKPSWLPSSSIYAVGSYDGLHLLDFFPDWSSPCRVHYDEEIKGTCQAHPRTQNGFVSFDEALTSCAAHPITGTIVAGTESSSLLVFSQVSGSCRGEDDDECQRC